MNSAHSSAAGPRFLTPVLLAALLILFTTLAILRPPNHHHGYMIVEAPENVRVTFVFTHQREKLADCEANIARLASATLASCPACIIKRLQCLTELSATQQALLSTDPLSTPSARLPGGVVVYTAPDLATALSACQESQRVSAKRHVPVTCFPANTRRPVSDRASKITAEQALWPMLALLAAGLTTWFACWLITRYEPLHAHFSLDPVASGPQSFHAVAAPRIGGLGLCAGLLASAGMLLTLQPLFHFDIAEFGYLLIAAAPAFLGGFAEDVAKQGLILDRLLMTLLAGSMGAWLLGAILNRFSIPGIDSAFLWPPFAVAVTIFAVAGVTNAINIIDGYNGLAGGFAVIVLAALAWVAARVGDGFIFTAALSLIGALLAFLYWNWPKGKLFLGDGGAYLIGFMLAELSVLLVVRNPPVSPWFPVVLLGYPIFETLFSSYRKMRRGHSATLPGRVHMHMLVYKRLIRWHVNSRDPQHRTTRNSLVAPYILLTPLAFAWFAIIFWQRTSHLMVAVLVGCALYVYMFWRITTWSVPKWLLITNRN